LCILLAKAKQNAQVLVGDEHVVVLGSSFEHIYAMVFPNEENNRRTR
jgi:hypothetical protein